MTTMHVLCVVEQGGDIWKIHSYWFDSDSLDGYLKEIRGEDKFADWTVVDVKENQAAMFFDDLDDVNRYANENGKNLQEIQHLLWLEMGRFIMEKYNKDRNRF